MPAKNCLASVFVALFAISTLTTCNKDEEDPKLPQVSTVMPTNIAITTADGGGLVVEDGGTPVTSRGICWNTQTQPTVDNNKMENGSGLGMFYSQMEGLQPATRYFVRAYAVNKVGTVYGEEFSFTTKEATSITVTTTVATEITSETATSGGNVTATGDAIIIQRGVVWSTEPSPAIPSTNKSVDGPGEGQFTANMSGLSYGTTYYARAFATHQNGTEYGNEITFETSAVIPQVTTASVAVTSSTEVSGGGNVVNDGRGEILARGVCWSTSPDPTVDLATKTSNGTGVGVFTSTFTGIVAGNTYYVRAFATNAAGTGYGSQVILVVPTLPELTTTSVSDITSNSAQSGGTIYKDGGSPVAAAGVCWSTTPNPTVALTTKTSDAVTRYFTSNITTLDGNVTYYLRAYATNIMGTAYGDEISFTTLEPGTIVDIDGNVYNLVQIGSQLWTKQNLSTTRFRDGSAILSTTTPSEFFSYASGSYHVPSNVPSYNDIYGKLYNYWAVSDSRKLCPTGSHVPTLAEWETMINHLGGYASAGNKLKEAGNSHWSGSNSGTNETEFTALPAGVIGSTGFSGVGDRAGWWTASPGSSGSYAMTISESSGVEAPAAITQTSGRSVRCVVD